MGFLFTLFISTPRHPILPREILIYLSFIPSSFCASLRIDRSSTSVREITRPTFASFKTNPNETRIMYPQACLTAQPGPQSRPYHRRPRRLCRNPARPHRRGDSISKSGPKTLETEDLTKKC